MVEVARSVAPGADLFVLTCEDCDWQTTITGYSQALMRGRRHWDTCVPRPGED